MAKKGEFINRLGEKHFTNEGYQIEIIKSNGSNECTIMFDDENNTILENIVYGNIKKGTINNPNKPTIAGVGYKGVGKFKCVYESIFYSKWINMIKRCYSYNLLDKWESYKGVTVCEEWHNFQVFAEWFEKNYNPEVMQGWHLDKDILIKGNKIYSPETCCFVPEEVNNMFVTRNTVRGIYPIGVRKHFKKFLAQIRQDNKTKFLGSFNTPKEAFQAYKTAKEFHIKEVADKWKDLIDPRVYQVMHNYQVEITD